MKGRNTVKVQYEEIGVFDGQKAAKALLELADKVKVKRTKLDRNVSNQSSNPTFSYKKRLGEAES